jgi:hypothetical protein
MERSQTRRQFFDLMPHHLAHRSLHRIIKRTAVGGFTDFLQALTGGRGRFILHRMRFAHLLPHIFYFLAPMRRRACERNNGAARRGAGRVVS